MKSTFSSKTSAQSYLGQKGFLPGSAIADALYVSDFSRGEDDWTGQFCGPVGNIDGIGGLNDNLSATPNGNLTALHFVDLSPGLVDGQQYRVRCKIYVPSAHSQAGTLIDLSGSDSVTV